MIRKFAWRERHTNVRGFEIVFVQWLAVASWYSKWAQMRITNAAVKESLIRALADDYSRKIMLSTIVKPDSVEGLSRSLDIPISTAYRRVNDLKESGILTVEKTILTEDGKKFELYRSAFRTFRIDLNQGEISIEAELNEDVAGRFARIWGSLKE
ncbi:MAG: helix-turn-helix transcriptional regulator [Nitrososphaerota archaeon]|nr:helix-turn-helix transcriptional regulator [Nitrososphaerota archaeon]